jgi:hypothetical protein
VFEGKAVRPSQDVDADVCVQQKHQRGFRLSGFFWLIAVDHKVVSKLPGRLE